MYQEISEKDVKERGLKVIDSRLILKEKRWWSENQTVCEGIRAHEETRFVCADTWDSDSQDPADSRTQERLDHEFD